MDFFIILDLFRFIIIFKWLIILRISELIFIFFVKKRLCIRIVLILQTSWIRLLHCRSHWRRETCKINTILIQSLKFYKHWLNHKNAVIRILSTTLFNALILFSRENNNYRLTIYNSLLYNKWYWILFWLCIRRVLTQFIAQRLCEERSEIWCLSI